MLLLLVMLLLTVTGRRVRVDWCPGRRLRTSQANLCFYGTNETTLHRWPMQGRRAVGEVTPRYEMIVTNRRTSYHHTWQPHSLYALKCVPGKVRCDGVPVLVLVFLPGPPSPHLSLSLSLSLSLPGRPVWERRSKAGKGWSGQYPQYSAPTTDNNREFVITNKISILIITDNKHRTYLPSAEYCGYQHTTNCAFNCYLVLMSNDVK